MTRIATVLATICILPGCVHFDRAKLTDWAAEKAARFAECQLQDPLSKQQAAACLGTFASDLGTDACGETTRWLDSLPAQE